MQNLFPQKSLLSSKQWNYLNSRCKFSLSTQDKENIPNSGFWATKSYYLLVLLGGDGNGVIALEDRYH